jgi:hypothetical protein
LLQHSQDMLQRRYKLKDVAKYLRFIVYLRTNPVPHTKDHLPYPQVSGSVPLTQTRFI